MNKICNNNFGTISIDHYAELITSAWIGLHIDILSQTCGQHISIYLSPFVRSPYDMNHI